MQQQAIQLYVGYRKYITAEQISDMLSGINGIYDSLFFIETPVSNAPRQTSTKLRVGRAETGSSIIFDLVQGTQQVIHAVDPELKGVAGGVAVLALTGRVLINNFKRGSLAWYEHRSQELSIREKKALLELKERTTEVVAASLAEVSVVVPRTVNIDQLAETIGPQLALVDKALSQQNIVRAVINDEVLKDSAQE